MLGNDSRRNFVNMYLLNSAHVSSIKTNEEKNNKLLACKLISYQSCNFHINTLTKQIEKEVRRYSETRDRLRQPAICALGAGAPAF